MSVIGLTGEVVKEHVEELFKWRIPNFSSLTNCNPNCYRSPSFSFASSPYHLRIYPEDTDEEKFYICVYLLREGEALPIEGTYTIEILGIEDVEQFDNISNVEEEDGYLLPIMEWVAKSKLLLDDTLTVICKLNYIPTLQEEARNMRLIELETLSENFKELLSAKETCDTTLQLNDAEFRVHKSVLIARSSVFAAMFKHDMSEKRTSVISVVDCESKSFQQFLEYLYTGRMEKVTFDSAFHLYVTADKYDVQKLKMFCLEYMVRNVAVDNMCDIVVLASDYEEDALFAAAQKFFNRNMGKIFETDRWNLLMVNNVRLAQKLLINMVPTVKVGV